MDRFVYKKTNDVTVLSASMADFKYKMHAHQEYALGVTKRGIQQYNLGGSFYSSYPTSVMLFNPEQSHDGMSHDQTGIEYVMLYIDPTVFSEIFEKKGLPHFSSPVIFDTDLRHMIINLSQAVLDEKDEAFCSELLLNLADCIRPNLGLNDRKDDFMTRKAKDIIQCSLSDAIRLDDISKVLDISKYQFIRAFKASTGISPYQYFLNCKVEHAKQLIEKTGDIYTAVAEYGFVDITHLNRHFKSVYGITAHEYLLSVRNAAITV